MLKVNQLTGFGIKPNLTTIHELANFPGTSGAPYLTKGALSGDADGKTGTCAFWVRFNGGDGGLQYIYSENDPSVSFNGLFISRTAANKLRVAGYSSAGVNVLNIITSGTYAVSSGLLHFVASWDLANTVAHIYVNGVSDYDSGADVLTNTNIDHVATLPVHAIGIRAKLDGQRLNGCLGGFYLSRTYIDLSNANNLVKFYNPANDSNFPTYSVSLGSDGSAPESAQPIIYLNDGLSAGTNAGSGGNFTVNGTISAC